ncbi:MAG TPA: hypothetical protein PKO09_08900 [Anaerolineae bacterium]|nr:hypothetical protein [Anaerolineae bacterium]
MRDSTVRSLLIAAILLAAALPLHAREASGPPAVPVLRAAPPLPRWGAAGVRAAAGQRPDTATVLIVDDDWDYDFTVPGSQGGLPYYTSALDLLGLTWSVWDVQSLGQPDGAALEGYETIVWFTGYAFSAFEQDPGVFTADNEATVAAYLAAGGNLILSSQEYYYDCCDNGPLTPFMKNYLGLLDIFDDVTATATVGVAGTPVGDGLGPYAMARPDDYGVYWPGGLNQGPYDDEVISRPVAVTPFSYASPWNTGYAATSYADDLGVFKTLYLAWPLEWIDTPAERAQILGTALSWMGVSLPALSAPVLEPIANADGNSEYRVDWSDVPGATYYLLQEDDDPAFGSPAARYSGPESHFDVAQQEPGTWHYRVQAHNPGEGSGWSNTASATVSIPAPAAPLLNPIDNPAHGNSFTVDWSDVSGATRFLLQEDEYESFYSPETAYDGAESSAQIMDHPGGTWYYRVRVTTEGGTSVWSNVEPIDIVPLAPALRPIRNTEGDGDYWVMWSTPSGATAYTLQEDDDPEFGSPVEYDTGSGTAHFVEGQSLGAWYYRVAARSDFGSSSWSNIQSTGVFSGAPQLEPIENGDGDDSYPLVWDTVGGAIGYRLEEDSDPAFATPIVRYEGPATQFDITEQLSGTWHYRVLAYNEGGVSPYSNTQSVTVPGLYLPLILWSW